ncbi:MAG: glycoside hydrolase family 97 catalytic domain-containing protein [Bacteroidales bacterium]
MKKAAFFPILAVVFLTACSLDRSVVSVSSPDKKIRVDIRLDKKGAPTYSVYYNELQILEPSTLGLVLDQTDLTRRMKIASEGTPEAITDRYTLVSGKKRECTYRANRRVIAFEPREGIRLNIVFQVSNDGVAFRYELNGEDPETRVVSLETTGFNFPESATAWLHPHQVAQSGWESTQPSYEENYEMEIPVGTESNFGQGWSFPALFRSNAHWVLVSETDMVRHYCGSHLGHLSPEGQYTLAFPQEPETMGPDEPLYPTCNLPFHSPWRILIIGETLAPIVESTLATDVSRPSLIQDTSFIKPGRSSWSWVLLKDDSTVYEVQKRFIDYSADMGWEYCLIDCYWDTKIGYEKIEELARYAEKKGVGLILWYNSNGTWNTAPLTPRDRVADPEIRRKEFARISRMGIKGLKIDFFGGDGQSFMNYYQDLMEDAARYGLVVNFHGATIPRGWTRTYPNLMTMESVKGFEYITFEQPNANRAPAHGTVLPFTRNATGPMDFTPVCFSEIPRIRRRTTNGYELATSVLFQSGIQHFAAIPRGMYSQPDYVVEFMRRVPVAWDEVKYIDGYPGKFAVLARRAGNTWYVAGINGENTERSLRLDLSVLGETENPVLITDGEGPRDLVKTVPEGSGLDLTLRPYGGFVCTVNQKE